MSATIVERPNTSDKEPITPPHRAKSPIALEGGDTPTGMVVRYGRRTS